MSSQGTGTMEIITDWQAALDRTAELAESESLALSPLLYKSDSDGAVSVVVGVYSSFADPLTLELEEEDYLKLLEQWISASALRFIIHDLKSCTSVWTRRLLPKWT